MMEIVARLFRGEDLLGDEHENPASEDVGIQIIAGPGARVEFSISLYIRLVYTPSVLAITRICLPDPARESNGCRLCAPRSDAEATR